MVDDISFRTMNFYVSGSHSLLQAIEKMLKLIDIG